MTPRRALAAALLATALAAAAAPALAAPGDATLVLNVVDQYGRPTAGVVRVVDSTGATVDEQGASAQQPQPFAARHAFTVRSDRRYGVVSVTPWSGLDCFQSAPCTDTGSPVVSGGYLVLSGQTLTPTLTVTVPTVTGSVAPGSALSVAQPAGITRFNTSQGGSTGIGVQWLRGATAIAGATAPTYTTTGDDGGQSVSARLTPSPTMVDTFAAYPGAVQPFQTNALAIAPATTTTKVRLPKSFATSERVELTVKVKAAVGTPTGEVKVRIGAYGDVLDLKAGKAEVRLPRFAVGTYRVTVKYAGTTAYAKSGSKKLRISVTR